MKILLVGNNFTGAYGSLHCFIEEIDFFFKKMGCEVFPANTVREAVEIYDNYSIDFSIGIGKYSFFLDGRALYDIYRIQHYQWIIDNPLKMKIDTESSFIKYILIDKLFENCVEKTKLPFLFCPLGIPGITENYSVEKRDNGIVFAGQIRDCNLIYENITLHKCHQDIKKILDVLISDLDSSYILTLERNTQNLKSDEKAEVFSLTNSFIRTYKREKVLDQIRGIPVFILGENQSKVLSQNSNITLLGKHKYYESFDIMKKYMFSLHIEPNFNYGFHDRILRAAIKGNIVITNDGLIQREILKNNALYYRFSNIEDITNQILHMTEEEMKNMSSGLSETVSNNFAWEKILQYIVMDFGGGKNYENDRLYRILGN